MAILKIARMGHPVLWQTAQRVADPTAPAIRRLIADMMETMEDAPGVGLAAPQVHVPLRLFVFRVPAERSGSDPDDAAIGNSVLINPEIVPVGDDIRLRWEGCLSIPGLRGAVPRPWRVRYRGLDAEGKAVEREVTGLHAGVVQHETDHLDGVLYPMRMTDMALFGFDAELARYPAPELGGMIEPPEQSPERDAAIAALLPHVAELGWTAAALRAGLRDLGRPAEDALLLFPGGAADLVEAFADWADRRMAAAGAELVAELRVSQRVRALIALRLEQGRPYKGAVRRAVALLALPRHSALASRVVARTVDAIWHAAGDRSADFSWYSKRAILTGVYSATVLFWLGDDAEDDAATLGFLDRRLAGVARLGRISGRASEWVRRCSPLHSDTAT